MKPPDDAKARISAAASLAALTEAWRRREDLLAHGSAEAAPALLREHAAKMARSPLAQDQVLSLALLAAADDVGVGWGGAASQFLLAEPGPEDAQRLGVRMRVLNSSFAPAADARHAARELERRHRPGCGSDRELAARLVADADLHERLWDDPRLPGDDRTRLIMLFAIPQLLERADALDLPEGPRHGGQPRARRRPSTAQRLVGRLTWARLSAPAMGGLGGKHG